MASPKRAMPDRSPSASASASPRTMATSSTVWWASTSRSPRAFTSRSKRACTARARSRWSRNATPVAISAVPSPSRLRRTDTSVSLVWRFLTADRSAGMCPPLGKGVDEAGVLLRGPHRDADESRERGAAGKRPDHKPATEKPWRGPLAGMDKEKVPGGGVHRQGETCEMAGQRLAARHDARNALAHPVQVAQCPDAQPFRDDAQAPGRTDPAQCGADLRPGERVADPHAREPEGLTQRADHHEVGKPSDQPDGGDRRKLEVGLVDSDHAGCFLGQLLDEGRG